MKIIVLVKQILDPAGLTFRRDKERMFINREDYIVDPASKAAIEAALRLQEAAGGDGSVTALSAGPVRAEDALREALAMGAGEAYLLTGEGFAEADAAGVTRILAAAVEKLGGADLIVAGSASTDSGGGQIGARLAEALDYAQVTGAFELAGHDGALRATRRWRGGYAAVQVPLPAVVTVASEAFPPRYPPGARIMSAYRDWAVTAWGAEELGLSGQDLAPQLAFRRESFPPPLPEAERYRGAPADAARDAVAVLRAERIVSGKG
jgi:electron transfer flavoprotein beta subunit